MDKTEIESTRKFIKDNLAQKSRLTDRFYKEINRKHLGDDFEKYIYRDEFSRDADRIVYSKAFRRLEHKEQVYSNKLGDHYRTRLTHSLEVAQIARSISRNLGLNEHLAESIALGHDIGHTPFGHPGEAVLDDILRGKDDLGGKLTYCLDYGGFKHNFNGLKIVESIEKRNERTGLNLTWQTLDGILKHTSVIKKNKKWDYSRFVKDSENYKTIVAYDYFDSQSRPQYDFSITMEGQAAAIADEIAQREHDLDDSLIDGDLFTAEKLAGQIRDIAEDIINDDSAKQLQGYELFKAFYDKLSELGKVKNYLQWHSMASIIISYFIVDVSQNTLRNVSSIENIDDVVLAGDDNRRYITKHLVVFSPIGDKFFSTIDEFVETRIINSFIVNRYDEKGKFIVRKLFKAYYENPRQMPRRELITLVKNIKKTLDSFPQLKDANKFFNNDFEDIYDLNENNVDIKNLGNILDCLKLNIFLKESFFDSDCADSILNDMGIEDEDDESLNQMLNYCNKHTADELESMDCGDFLMILKGLAELHYVYIDAVSEYIARMTDDYAMKEYCELYSVNHH